MKNIIETEKKEMKTEKGKKKLKIKKKLRLKRSKINWIISRKIRTNLPHDQIVMVHYQKRKQKWKKWKKWEKKKFKKSKLKSSNKMMLNFF